MLPIAVIGQYYGSALCNCLAYNAENHKGEERELLIGKNILYF